MSSGSWPNFNAWLDVAWGSGGEFWAFCNQSLVIGPSFGQNPPYYLDNFATFYPKWFGPATQLANCTLTINSGTVNVLSTNGLAVGQFVQAVGLPPNSVINSVGTGQITVTTQATLSGSVTLTTYQNPPMPVAVIQAYLQLAVASLVYTRWQEQWYVAIGLFISHYCDMYLQSDAPSVLEAFQTVMHGETPAGVIPGSVYTLSALPSGGTLQSLTKNGKFLVPGNVITTGVDYTLQGTTITLAVATVLNDVLYAVWPIQELLQTQVPQTPAQIAAAGIATGILTSKAVGDVSAGYTPLTALESWGAWNLTKYGQLLSTMGAVIGSGPALIW